MARMSSSNNEVKKKRINITDGWLGAVLKMTNKVCYLKLGSSALSPEVCNIQLKDDEVLVLRLALGLFVTVQEVTNR